MNSRRVSRIERDWIPYPKVLVEGVGAWTNLPFADCPACGGRLRDRHGGGERLTFYCLRCDSIDPEWERKRSELLLKERRRERVKFAQEQAARELPAAKKVVLSERQRRLLWNGNRSSIERSIEGDLPSIVQVTRKWLREIGQEPDWSLDPATLPGGGFRRG